MKSIFSENVAQVFIDESGQYFYHTVEGDEMVIMNATQKHAVTPGCLELKNIKRSSSPVHPDSPNELHSHDEKVWSILSESCDTELIVTFLLWKLSFMITKFREMKGI